MKFLKIPNATCIFYLLLQVTPSACSSPDIHIQVTLDVALALARHTASLLQPPLFILQG